MNRKKRQFVLSAILLLLLSVLPAFAADVTGTWTSQVKTNDGDPLLITFVFQQDGTKLTGTIGTPRETVKMSDGRIGGEKILFTATFTNATFHYEGLIAGDEIKVIVTVPEFPARDLTLTRSK